MNALHILTLHVGHNVGDKPTHTTDAIADACTNVLGIQGATLTETLGIWQGTREASTRVDIVADSEECARVLARVSELARVLDQDAILALVDNAEPAFIER